MCIFGNWKIVFKIIASFIACVFLWKETAWASGAEISDNISTINEPVSFVAAGALIQKQVVAEGVIAAKQDIESYSFEQSGASVRPFWISLFLKASQAVLNTVSCTYYSSGLIESRTLVTPDSSGNVYYHYLNEDWAGCGFGRIDQSVGQSALDGFLAYSDTGELTYAGEISYIYSYYDDAQGRLKEKKAYSDTECTNLIATYTYYNDSFNRVFSKAEHSSGITYTYYNNYMRSLESKILTSPDYLGNIYYHYIDLRDIRYDSVGENFSNSNPIKIDRSLMQAPVNGELSYSYLYYTSNPERMYEKISYSDSNWAERSATYIYYDNDENRLASKIDHIAGIVYEFYDDVPGRVSSKTLLFPDVSEMQYYHYMDEDWNNRGYGRVDRSYSQTVSGDGEISYKYSYYQDIDGRLQTIETYSDENWTALVGTFNYSNDNENGMESIKDPKTGAIYTFYPGGNIKSQSLVICSDFDPGYINSFYFSYIDENWNNRGYGRVDKASLIKPAQAFYPYSYYTSTYVYIYADDTPCPKTILFTGIVPWDSSQNFFMTTTTSFYSGRYEARISSWPCSMKAFRCFNVFGSFEWSSYFECGYDDKGVVTSVSVWDPIGRSDGLQKELSHNWLQQNISDTNSQNDNLPNGIDLQKDQIALLNMLDEESSSIWDMIRDREDLLEDDLLDMLEKAIGGKYSDLNLTLEAKKAILAYVLFNGINNQSSYGAPAYMGGIEKQLELADPSGAIIESIAMFPKSKWVTGNPIFDDSVAWIGNAYLGFHDLIDDIMNGMQSQFGNQTPSNMVGIAYSGGGDPLIQALNIRQDWKMKSVVLVNAPLGYGRQITNPNVENIVLIGGTKDPLSEQGFMSQGFDNNYTPINLYKIALQGIEHTQFSYDPNDTNPDPKSVQSARFTAYVAKISNDVTRMNQFLTTTEGITYNAKAKIYYVDLNKVVYEN